jgi:hypothetical protein
MRKGVKVIMSALLGLTILGSVACTGVQPINPGLNHHHNPAENYTVWAASTAEKFKQDDFSNAKEGNMQINMEAVKNEYESAQLIISTLDDIASYYLEKSDLVCGENSISASNVQVYNVLYVELSSERDLANYGGGIYPDALVPIEKAKEYGELKASANTNVQLWITVYVPKETVAGVYNANFKLTIDGKEIAVPVSVTVYDYTLTDKNNAPSMFTYRQDRIGVGELDNSTAMMEKYYDYHWQFIVYHKYFYPVFSAILILSVIGLFINFCTKDDNKHRFFKSLILILIIIITVLITISNIYYLGWYESYLDSGI